MGDSDKVSYIENPSTAYIDTGITLANTDRVVIELSHYNGNFISGRNGRNGNNRFFLSTDFQWEYRPSSPTAINDGNYHSVECKAGGYIVDGTSFPITEGTGDVSETGNVLIFGAWNQTNSSLLDFRRATCRIYSFDIIDGDGNYKFKGRPTCKGGRYGLKDAVSGNFFGSASDVEFIGA